jgi:hypothetical protein
MYHQFVWLQKENGHTFVEYEKIDFMLGVDEFYKMYAHVRMLCLIDILVCIVPLFYLTAYHAMRASIPEPFFTGLIALTIACPIIHVVIILYIVEVIRVLRFDRSVV